MNGRRSRSGQISFALLALKVFLAGAAALVIFVEHKLSQLVLGGLGESFSTRVYSAPYPIDSSHCPSPAKLLERLRRLSYAPADGTPAKPGEYVYQPPTIAVYLRGYHTPAAYEAAGLYTLTENGACWDVRGSSGPVAQASLEPEVAAELSGVNKVLREPAASAEIPDLLKKAVVATEDRRFYSHFGIDWHGVARAVVNDVTGKGALQGGSTITQQLCKNLFLNPKRTLRRKAAEAALALYMELRYGKDRILTIYLNHIYLGQDGSYSVAGVKAAAKFYFGKDLSELTLAQQAAIAGIIRSPHRYNPVREPAAAKERRDFVLRRMLEEGYITEPQRAQAAAEPLGAVSHPPREDGRRDNDYYVAEVVRQLLPRYGEEAIFTHGLSIYTAMDPLLQKAAQGAVQRARPQGALVALDPASGLVAALSGGRDFGESQFNRATQAQRQPGSAFKPFVYGAALESGKATAASILLDQPKKYPRTTDQTWDPRNYDGIYLGTVTAREAIAHSLNAATLDLAQRIGPPAIVTFARKLGVASPIAADLGSALGASEVNLLELTAAYAAFDNGGFAVRPRLVLGVTDAEGEVLEVSASERAQAVTAPLAYLVTTLLEGVVDHGTARSLSALGWTRPAAGKTGTTNDGRDAWFVGYTPALVTGVWVGDDQHKPLRATGAKDALPIWAIFMSAAAQESPLERFAEPSGLARETIDPASGLRARSGCPQRVAELFLPGTQPTQDCPLHPGGLKGLFHRFFGRGS